MTPTSDLLRPILARIELQRAVRDKARDSAERQREIADASEETIKGELQSIRSILRDARRSTHLMAWGYGHMLIECGSELATKVKIFDADGALQTMHSF